MFNERINFIQNILYQSIIYKSQIQIKLITRNDELLIINSQLRCVYCYFGNTFYIQK